ncbi:unnamed protein product [Amoebophrya sp. A120]|nr:unnamed protein product [Amoebophrya sp. A120]|eukprot:GSA120T00014482001.1
MFSSCFPSSFSECVAQCQHKCCAERCLIDDHEIEIFHQPGPMFGGNRNNRGVSGGMFGSRGGSSSINGARPGMMGAGPSMNGGGNGSAGVAASSSSGAFGPRAVNNDDTGTGPGGVLGQHSGGGARGSNLSSAEMQRRLGIEAPAIASGRGWNAWGVVGGNSMVFSILAALVVAQGPLRMLVEVEVDVDIIRYPWCSSCLAWMAKLSCIWLGRVETVTHACMHNHEPHY